MIERLSADAAFREEYFTLLTKHNEARKVGLASLCSGNCGFAVVRFGSRVGYDACLGACVGLRFGFHRVRAPCCAGEERQD